MKKHDPDFRCCHGRLLWWNFGDGKPRHFDRSDKYPVPVICEETRDA